MAVYTKNLLVEKVVEKELIAGRNFIEDRRLGTIAMNEYYSI